MTNQLFDLSNYALINVHGERAADFLQGQLTCDVRDVTPQIMRKGALCNLKGRILALLDVINWQGYQLILPDNLLTHTLNSLNKTALVSRVRLERNPDCRLFGFYLANPDDWIPFPLPSNTYDVISNDHYCCYALGDKHYIIAVNNAKAESLISKRQMQHANAWHHLRLQQQDSQIYPESRGLFLPHRLDLHKTNGISFDKGCYKGQEIIARTHYLAKRKHELKTFTIHSTEPLSPGQALLHPDTQSEVGELIDFSAITTNHYLIIASLLVNHPDTLIPKGHQQSIFLQPLT